MGWSWRFDGDGLKLLSLGFALAAIIMIFVIELHWHQIILDVLDKAL